MCVTNSSKIKARTEKEWKVYVTVLCPSASPISKLYKWKFQSLKMVLKSFRGYCLLLYLLVNCRAISFKWELLSDNSRWQSRASPVTSTGQHLGELIRESIYADDIDLMVGTNSKIQALTNRLDRQCECMSNGDCHWQEQTHCWHPR